MDRVGESYAQNMLATRGQRHDDDDGRVDQMGRGGALQVVAPVGAIKVAVERDDAKVLRRIKVLASAAGSRFYYRFPAKNKDGSSSNIEGPSIDCALAVARTWGNCDVDCRVMDEGDHWIFHARFRDFETGFTLSRAFQQRKGQTTMKTKDPGRALDIVFQIGQSKAIRNVICNALGDVTAFAFEEARASFVDRIGSKLDYYRERAINRLAELKIELKRVEAVLGKPAKDWLAHDLARIIAELQAINDGMSSADETYPLLEQGQPVSAEEPTRSQAAMSQNAASSEAAKADTPAETVDQETGEVFDAEAFVTDAEEKARKGTALTDLGDLDGAVTGKLKDAGIADDDDLPCYWRRVVAREKKRIEALPQDEKNPAEQTTTESDEVSVDADAEIAESIKRLESCHDEKSLDDVFAGELERLKDLGIEDVQPIIGAANAQRLAIQKAQRPAKR